MRGRDNILFMEGDMYAVMDQQRAAIDKEVLNLNADRVLGTPAPDLISYYSNKFTIDVPELHTDRAVLDPIETKILLSDRFQYDLPRGPIEVNGMAYILTVPFTGDEILFRVRPTQWDSMPPRADVSRGNVVIRVEGRDLAAEKVNAELQSTLKTIEQYLTWQRGSADSFNTSLPQLIGQILEQRRSKLLKDRQTVSGLAFPVRQRADAPRTFAAPEVRKKVLPTLPPAPREAFKPEPVLDDKIYKHILSVIENMTHVMERSPTAFRDMGEEDLRQHFLVQLNGHFEGSATGETFNYTGKTDILIRSDDRNIFIGECKFWRGEKAFIDTINQILGYLSWRDTKAALLIFNRNKGFSQVVTTARQAMEAHPQKKRGPNHEGETRSRYVFGSAGDPNREIILTLMIFDVPTETGP